VTGLDHQGKIWGVGSRITGSGLLLVGVRLRHVVRGLSGALEHIANIVRSISVLEFLGHGLDLSLGVRNTDQVAPCNAVERVAGSANLLVNLVTTADTMLFKTTTLLVFVLTSSLVRCSS
jgi:hypothetical protein